MIPTCNPPRLQDAQAACAGARPASRPPRAFTLVELLIVIGIIAILVSMAVVVGTKVVEGGKARATQDVIRVLDTSLGAWHLNADKPVPEVLEIPQSATKSLFYPIIDARLADSGEPYDQSYWVSAASSSGNLYTALVMQDASIAAEFQQLDSTFIKPHPVPQDPDDGAAESWSLAALDIQDAWGHSLRFVHPAFHGGHGEYWDADRERLDTQREPLKIKLPTSHGGNTIPVEFRRSYRPFEGDDPNRKTTWIGDADEGMTIGGTPYFYSPGDDGDPGTRANNVYSTRPRFPVETRDFE